MTIQRTFLSFLLVTPMFIGGLFFGFYGVRTAWSQQLRPYESIRLLATALHIIENNAFIQPERDELIDGAIWGMTQQLDQHSKYHSAQEYKKLKQAADGWSVGAGLELNLDHVVMNVLPHGPAELSGIMVGDTLLKIDNHDLNPLKLKEIQALLTGEKGSSLTLLYLRNGKEFSTEVIRDEIKSKPLEMIKISDQDIYIRLDSFKSNIVEELNDYFSEHNPNRAILDLRENGGGLIDEGIALADFFLSDGEITSLIDREDVVYEQHEAKEGDAGEYVDLVILINGKSASASELVAGALQQNKRAELVGTPTFGKSSMQKIYEFGESSALRITVSHYLLPDGHKITPEEPLLPDHEVLPHLNDPKKDLFDEINTLNIKSSTKKRLIQRLQLLETQNHSSSIAFGGSFENRRKSDPQLDKAWSLLTKEP